ncbi:hypothetical protein B6S59_27585 [Pseudomonas sp. A46]|uniref:hypothetical protein n=1 Tax=Metapseudomonas furukawaii TaxID=1149133 RepID=UPI000B49E4DB|nr:MULTISPECIES: hypothetical protein [Pseudomonas]OWJ90574.1 hypothetical protein B6S59_27585 [Pseudomonas sp. A46]WAG77853.1 hypothetical protein LMK08_21185 [Pseudomonas furukawaii]
MTTIASNALASYLGLSSRSTGNTGGTPANGGNGSTPDTAEGTSSPRETAVADLRRYANALIAQSQGGLFRAMNGSPALNGSQFGATQSTGQKTGTDANRIPLPDVAELDRDEALKLKDKVQTLIDAGFDEKDSGFGFVGYDGDQQTTSLATYRDWLQAKGGISLYV